MYAYIHVGTPEGTYAYKGPMCMNVKFEIVLFTFE